MNIYDHINQFVFCLTVTYTVNVISLLIDINDDSSSALQSLTFLFKDLF